MGHHFREQDTYTQILEVTPALRHRIEATIERLVALLDALDGDLDFEDSDPIEDSDADEDGGDLEPSLGWRNPGCNSVGAQDAIDFSATVFGSEDREEDQGEMPEWDIADFGLADRDALDDPELSFFRNEYDGSGVAIGMGFLWNLK